MNNSINYDEPDDGSPAPGDYQRRCWTSIDGDDGFAQCELYNGHKGSHDIGERAALPEALMWLRKITALDVLRHLASEDLAKIRNFLREQE